MKKSQKTKTKLLSSLVLLLLSMTMFLGTTFAWFTDSVTSSGNNIQSGTLKVEMYYTEGTEDPNSANTTWTDASTGTIFNHDLWEPGYTEVKHIQIKNNGTLALKYKIDIVATGEVSKLTDVIDVYYVDPAVKVDARTLLTDNYKLGTLTDVLANLDTDGTLGAGETDTITLALKMQETAGNDYQGLSIGSSFAVQLVATQASVESDSFGPNYDINAEYPVLVSNAEELKAALSEGGNVRLDSDVTVESTMTIATDAETTIDLNGHDIAFAVDNNGKASAIINNKGTLNLEGEGTLTYVASDPDTQAIPAYATNTITNTGTLTIGKGVTVKNDSEGGASYAVDNHGVFFLNGGTLIGNRCALRVAKYNQDNVVFVMNGGTIEAKTPVWIQLPGSNASVAPNISVTINDGLIKTTNASSDDNNVLYTYSFGNSHANTSITINGGEFLGGVVSIGSGYKGDVATLTINGGTFEYDVMQWLAGEQSTVLYPANK